MKIAINIDPKYNDVELVINTPNLTPEVEDLIAALRMMDNRMTVIKDGESHILDVSKIAYIESVDRKTFVYTENDCFETKMKLYEVEERLCSAGFQRISKSCLVRLGYIRSLRAELDRRIRITLENSEQIMVSRQYSDELKRRLGVK